MITLGQLIEDLKDEAEYRGDDVRFMVVDEQGKSYELLIGEAYLTVGDALIMPMVERV